MTRSQPPAQAGPPDQDGLADALILLAGTADDDSTIGARLGRITQLCADLLDPVAFASVTRQFEGRYSTVAVSSALALAVDEAQYADNAGPCLDALDGGSPTVVPHIDATMSWPGFRDAAYRLGLHSSLSIPLFAGRGLPVAALNLYGHDPAAMAPLSAAVLDAYEESPERLPAGPRGDLGAGAQALVDGIVGAFAVRATIQRAIGMIIAERRTNPDLAYALLRSRAAETTGSLIGVATSLVTEETP
ncbi:GAF and ANTAR domain-containing protein [Actinoplanes nipponensis]|uniref:GAF and ANTAR domain-containing protein n=1 Tax=Actinoplanes nipponensis TaxID=135950 RepID=UPI001EF2924D|nr:GAF and ANTAR domain-containing protein [Actinoplanes nipponensis]